MLLDPHITEKLSALRRSVDEGVVPTAALNDLCDAAREAAGEALNDVIRALLADDWPDDPVLRGHFSVASGGLVEWRGDPRIGTSRLLDDLADGFTAIRDGGDAVAAAMRGEPYDKEAITPSQRRWLDAFHLHVVGAMARLARVESVRAEARAHQRLVEAVDAVWPKVYAAHIYYIATVLALFDDAPFVVADLPEGKVTRCRAFGANKVCEVLRALYADQADFNGSYWVLPHRYFSWQSLSVAQSGEVVASRTPQKLDKWRHPSEIPRFEGATVIVRVPGRSRVHVSEVGGVHDYLFASVNLEGELDAAEAHAFLLRMARAADADPPAKPSVYEDRDAGAGALRLTVLHPDGTTEGQLTDPIAQSVLEAWADERKAEPVVVYRPSDLPPALARALPSPKGAHDRLFFIARGSGSDESAIDDVMMDVDEPPMDEDDVEAGMALAAAVSDLASTNPAFKALVPSPFDPESGEESLQLGFHAGAADEVEGHLSAKGHRLIPVAEVLRGVTIVRVVDPDGTNFPRLIRAVRMGAVMHPRFVRPITAGLFVAVPPRESDECAFYSLDGTLVAYVAPGFGGDCQEVTLRPAEAHERLDTSTLVDNAPDTASKA